MTVTRAGRASGASKFRGHGTGVEKRRLEEEFIAADKRRRAAMTQRNREANRRAQADKGRPRRDARMATLLRLLDVVLEVEPWSLEFHDRKTGEAWGECARRVPEYLKEDGRTDHGMLVRRKVVRMCRRLQEPAARTLWKSETEVTRRLVEVAAGLATTRRYKDEFGMNQHEEPVEPKNVDVSR